MNETTPANPGAQVTQATQTVTSTRVDRRRHLIGRVVSNTGNPGRAKKTIIVEIVNRRADPVYGKYVRSRKRLHVHDEKNQYRTRDLVEIRESRPLSATKRWIAVRLIERPEEV